MQKNRDQVKNFEGGLKKRGRKFSNKRLRRGGGLKRSSSEKVRAVELDGNCGLLRLKIDGFLIPNRLKMDLRESLPGVVTVACG